MLAKRKKEYIWYDRPGGVDVGMHPSRISLEPFAGYINTFVQWTYVQMLVDDTAPFSSAPCF
jgi:hypothetical protein